MAQNPMTCASIKILLQNYFIIIGGICQRGIRLLKSNKATVIESKSPLIVILHNNVETGQTI